MHVDVIFDPRRWAAFTELSVWQNTIWAGFQITLKMAAIAMVVSLVAGLLLALLRTSRLAVIRLPVALFVEGVRSLPVLLLIFFSSLYLPRVGLAVDPFTAATVALAVYTSAVNAEIIRAGITSIERGQMEAARSLGLSYVRTMRFVVLPQALRRVVPPQVGQLVTLFKDTSLAAVIGVNELTRKMQILYQFERPPNPLQALFVAACIYFVVNYTLSRVSRRWELGVGGVGKLHGGDDAGGWVRRSHAVGAPGAVDVH